MKVRGKFTLYFKGGGKPSLDVYSKPFEVEDDTFENDEYVTAAVNDFRTLTTHSFNTHKFLVFNDLVQNVDSIEFVNGFGIEKVES